VIAVKKRLSDDSGAAAVLLALLLFFVLLGFAALAIDVGYWYAAKRQLQTSADSAALAGCRDLIAKADNGTIWATVTDYANRNFNRPLILSTCSVVPPSAGGLSDIGDDYVKVTVASQAPSFLSKIYGRGDTLIRAQSIARIGWLSGAGGPVPWGLAVIHVDEGSASLGGQTRSLSSGADGYWETNFTPGLSGALGLTMTNGQGYDEAFDNVLTIGTLSPSGRIADVDINKTTFTSGRDTSAHVTVTLTSKLATGGGNKVEASVDGNKKTLTKVTDTVYEGDVAIGTVDDPFRPMAFSVTVKEGSLTQTVTSQLLLRRANYILQDVEVDHMFVLPGDPVSLRVTTLDFEKEQEYQLKVEGGTGTTGNFQALDFDSIDHSQCAYGGDSGSHSGGSDYKQNIIGNPDIVMHIDDYVTSKPGNMQGPTAQGIKGRLALGIPRTYSEWIDAGRPNTKQLAIVPILERTEDPNGRNVMRVVSFATFYIQPYNYKPGDPVRGVFIDWVAPGLEVIGEQPDELAVEATHLSGVGLDF